MATVTMLVTNVMKHSVRNALSKNMSAEHKKKWHACDECDKTFATKCTLNNHLSAEHKKTCHACAESDKTLDTKSMVGLSYDMHWGAQNYPNLKFCKDLLQYIDCPRWLGGSGWWTEWVDQMKIWQTKPSWGWNLG